ncbi:TrkH family potassium uptake protein [Microaerobacter geothermalis]|uniref:TrkH family potassium uptake protein n=1 Tax=Microaerobacter geothermalis TaxID=674972 RepID=UPI001F186CD7|nr:TrkH family potassium uptake protein [Microaerobacter geothermalis]MCF6095305.1 TrkH family potassium uptake protein [Microaerobacter geothermalis]
MGLMFMKPKRKLSTVQIIVSFYLIATILATILISLPIFHKPGVELSFIDALFTAVSAISVTGLTVVNTADTFNVPGIIMLSFILQFGGIGIMTLGTFLWIVLGRQIGLSQRRLIMVDQNQSTLSGLVALMKRILGLAIGIEAIGTILLGTYFLDRYNHWYEAYYYGFFSALSAFTNAGFDIFGNSLFDFSHDYYVQTINILLLIAGAIGFPVLIELMDFLSGKYPNFRFSLYTKITTTTFFTLMLLGAVGIWLLDYKHFFADKGIVESIYYALFNSVTTRNGGLATMDVSLFNNATLLFMSFLMFVGASPSSVGGGIRTTTLAIIFLKIRAFSLGYKQIRVFNRELYEDDVEKTFAVIIMALLLLFVSSMILMAVEDFSPIEIIFEVASAFGTTGLSMGITPELSTVGKVVIIFLMFIGRIGILSLLFLLRREDRDPHFHYPKERIIVG